MLKSLFILLYLCDLTFKSLVLSHHWGLTEPVDVNKQINKSVSELVIELAIEKVSE